MRILLFIVIAALAVPGRAAAQTPSLNVPAGLIALDTSTPNRVVFTNVGPGLMRSVDEGFNWHPVFLRPAGQRQPSIYQVVIHPSDAKSIYAATDADDGGIWKSTDGGNIWAVANSGLPVGNFRVGPLIMGPQNAPATLWVKAGEGFYKTTDGAATWRRLGVLADTSPAFAVDFNDQKVMYTSRGSAVYRSTDEGATWMLASTLNIASGTIISSLLVDLIQPNVVIASAFGTGAGQGIYRSSDGAANFTRVHTAQSAGLVADPFGRPVHYASALEAGCFDRSVNRGLNWQRICVAPAAGGVRLGFDFVNPNHLWAATSSGIYRSTDLGATWLSRFGPARATLSAPPVALDFMLAAGTDGRLDLPLRVLETDRWTVPLSAVVPAEPWLSVTGIGGSTPANATVRVSAANLSPGSYNATIRITSSAAANSPLDIPVRLNVRAPAPEFSYATSTYAGTGQIGVFGDGGAAVRAAFGNPDSVAVAANGNVAISDPSNHAIRRVTPDGTINRFAGNNQGAYSGDGGEAVLASLRGPRGIAYDSAGRLYIADSANGRIRRVTPEGFIDTLATGLPGVRGIALDAQGNVYAAFPDEHLVAKVTPAGIGSAFAGTGVAGFRGDGGEARFARLTTPNDVAVDAAGNVYIADSGNHRIRVVGTDGKIRTIAGNGIPGFQGDGETATSLALANPLGIAADPVSGAVVIADTDNHRIRVVTREGALRTIAGSGAPGFAGDDGAGPAAQFRNPVDVAADARGNIYVADNLNVRVRRLDPPVIPQVVSLVGREVKLAPGGYFSIYGANMAAGTAAADATPLPATLGGVGVSVNGRDARLSFVSARQINGQVPVETQPGTAQFRLTRGGVSSPEFPAEVSASAPAILTFGANRAVAVNLDGQVNTMGTPAGEDSIVTVYLTGIGLTDNTVGNGEAAPADPLARPRLPFSAAIGGQPAEVLFLGLAPGFVGLGQANLRVPKVGAGEHAVTIKVGDAVSNSPVISVQ